MLSESRPVTHPGYTAARALGLPERHVTAQAAAPRILATARPKRSNKSLMALSESQHKFRRKASLCACRRLGEPFAPPVYGKAPLRACLPHVRVPASCAAGSTASIPPLPAASCAAAYPASMLTTATRAGDTQGVRTRQRARGPALRVAPSRSESPRTRSSGGEWRRCA